MPSGPTYEPIQTITLSSGASNIEFTSIPQTYTDLIIVSRVAVSDGYLVARFNNDSGTNYSRTNMFWGTSANSGTGNNETSSFIDCQTTTPSSNIHIWHIQNYSSSTTMKTGLQSYNNQPNVVSQIITSYRSTTAITSVKFSVPGANNIITGSSVTLYGIKAA